MVESLTQQWSLDLGAPFEPGGQCSWVAPAGPDLVLKIGWPHYEAEHEADGLRFWAGDGAVRLHDVATFGSTAALLLERCTPGTPLARAVPPPEQDVVVAGLLRRLWRSVPDDAPFRPLRQMCDAWAAEFRGQPLLDPGVVRAGLALLRSLPRDPVEPMLLCTDLHSENILAAQRESWLVIDPKPYVGDPAYDVVQHLLNAERLATDPVGLARRMAALLDLDADRVRQWLFARCVQQSASWPELVAVATRLAP
jgi:streptomycin 6-kinase